MPMSFAAQTDQEQQREVLRRFEAYKERVVRKALAKKKKRKKRTKRKLPSLSYKRGRRAARRQLMAKKASYNPIEYLIGTGMALSTRRQSAPQAQSARRFTPRRADWPVFTKKASIWGDLNREQGINAFGGPVPKIDSPIGIFTNFGAGALGELSGGVGTLVSLVPRGFGWLTGSEPMSEFGRELGRKSTDLAVRGVHQMAHPRTSRAWFDKVDELAQKYNAPISGRIAKTTAEITPVAAAIIAGRRLPPTAFGAAFVGDTLAEPIIAGQNFKKSPYDRMLNSLNPKQRAFLRYETDKVMDNLLRDIPDNLPPAQRETLKQEAARQAWTYVLQNAYEGDYNAPLKYIRNHESVRNPVFEQWARQPWPLRNPEFDQWARQPLPSESVPWARQPRPLRNPESAQQARQPGAPEAQQQAAPTDIEFAPPGFYITPPVSPSQTPQGPGVQPGAPEAPQQAAPEPQAPQESQQPGYLSSIDAASMSPEAMQQLEDEIMTADASTPPDELSEKIQRLLAAKTAAYIKAHPPQDGVSFEHFLGQKMAEWSRDGFTVEDIQAATKAFAQQGAPDVNGNPTREPAESIEEAAQRDPSILDQFIDTWNKLPWHKKLALVIGIAAPIVGLINEFSGGNTGLTMFSLIAGGLGLGHAFGLFDSLLGRITGPTTQQVESQPQAGTQPNAGGTAPAQNTTAPNAGGAAAGPQANTQPNIKGIIPTQNTVAPNANAGGAAAESQTNAQPNNNAAASQEPTLETQLAALGQQVPMLNSDYGNKGGRPDVFDSLEDARAFVIDWARELITDGQAQEIIAKATPQLRELLIAHLNDPATQAEAIKQAQKGVGAWAPKVARQKALERLNEMIKIIRTA